MIYILKGNIKEQVINIIEEFYYFERKIKEGRKLIDELDKHCAFIIDHPDYKDDIFFSDVTFSMWKAFLKYEYKHSISCINLNPTISYTDWLITIINHEILHGVIIRIEDNPTASCLDNIDS